jgi:hypothetical protein
MGSCGYLLDIIQYIDAGYLIETFEMIMLFHTCVIVA